MSKKIFIALTAFAFIAIASANSAEARHHHWWQKAWHSASHAISHEAHVVAHGAEHAAKEVAKGAKAAANYVKANAHRACLKGMPVVIKSVVGKACKAASIEVGGLCNAALDAETGGLASAACTASGLILYATCSHEGGKVTRGMSRSITHQACAKI